MLREERAEQAPPGFPGHAEQGPQAPIVKGIWAPNSLFNSMGHRKETWALTFSLTGPFVRLGQ